MLTSYSNSSLRLRGLDCELLRSMPSLMTQSLFIGIAELSNFSSIVKCFGQMFSRFLKLWRMLAVQGVDGYRIDDTTSTVYWPVINRYYEASKSPP